MTVDTVPITDERLIYVLLWGEEMSTTKALIDFILDGIFFKVDPQFVRPEQFGDGAFSRLEVIWDVNRPPVILERVDTAALGRVLEEAHQLFEVLAAEPDSSAQPERARHELARTRAAVRITFDGETMTEGAWMMLDCVEAHLAWTYGGLIYVKNEGFYDSALQPLLRRRPK